MLSSNDWSESSKSMNCLKLGAVLLCLAIIQLATKYPRKKRKKTIIMTPLIHPMIPKIKKVDVITATVTMSLKKNFELTCKKVSKKVKKPKHGYYLHFEIGVKYDEGYCNCGLKDKGREQPGKGKIGPFLLLFGHQDTCDHVRERIGESQQSERHDQLVDSIKLDWQADRDLYCFWINSIERVTNFLEIWAIIRKMTSRITQMRNQVI